MSVVIPTTLDHPSAAALSGMMPDIDNPRIISRVEWDKDHTSGDLRYYVAGRLPSGDDYEVPLTLDLQAISRDEKGAWLNSIELARELRRAAHVFSVAAALAGKRNDDAYLYYPRPCNPFVGSQRTLSVLASAIVTGDAQVLISEYIDPANPKARKYQHTDMALCNPPPHRNSFRIVYEIGSLCPRSHYMLTSLQTNQADGSVARTQCNVPFHTV